MYRTGKITIWVALWAAVTVASAFAGPASQSANTPSASTAGAISDKAPKAVFPVVTYHFEPVFEGAELRHDFVVENHGEAPLVINRIRPD